MPDAATLLGESLGGIADELVEQAVQAAVQQQVTQIAKTAVEQALTPQLLEQLRISAAKTASRTIAAAPESSVSAPGTEEVEEAPPELNFGSVDEFVREYLIHHYKRQSLTAADQRCGHRTGGAMKKRSTASKLSGERGSFCAWTPRRG